MSASVNNGINLQDMVDVILTQCVLPDPSSSSTAPPFQSFAPEDSLEFSTTSAALENASQLTTAVRSDVNNRKPTETTTNQVEEQGGLELQVWNNFHIFRFAPR